VQPKAASASALATTLSEASRRKSRPLQCASSEQVSWVFQVRWIFLESPLDSPSASASLRAQELRGSVPAMLMRRSGCEPSNPFGRRIPLPRFQTRHRSWSSMARVFSTRPRRDTRRIDCRPVRVRRSLGTASLRFGAAWGPSRQRQRSSPPWFLGPHRATSGRRGARVHSIRSSAQPSADLFHSSCNAQ
jgi:hypothetical protein